MKLIFHVGLPKTGSSYLQSFLFQKASILKTKGIYFPIPSNLDKDSISKAGNCKELCRLMSLKQYNNIIKYLDKLYTEAEENNCDVILLSQEEFYSQIPKLDNNNIFKNWLLKRNIENIDVIIVIRDLYDFLISLYKQRCRTGKNIQPKTILEEKDNLEKIIKFFKSDRVRNSNLHIINYDEHKSNLKEIFIEHTGKASKKSFLDVNLNFNRSKVNRSLTLREIKFLQNLDSINSRLALKVSQLLSKKSFLKESESLKTKFKLLTEENHK